MARRSGGAAPRSTAHRIRLPIRTGRRAPARVGWLVALTASLAVLTAACAAGDVPEVPADDAQLVEGRALWAANCVNCHGNDGSGGVGTKLNGGALTELYPDPADQLQVVVEGRRAMPSFDDKFTDEELDAVVRYTREIIAEGP